MLMPAINEKGSLLSVI